MVILVYIQTGGTTDITVHEKQVNGVKELDKASGCDVGGRSVDKEFMNMFDRLFQGLIREKVKKENPTEYLGLYKEFEDVKKSISPDTTGNVRIPLPCMLLSSTCKKYLNKTLEQIETNWNDTRGNIKIQIRNDKLIVASDDLKSLFEPSIEKIIRSLREVIRKNDVSLVVLVGGFAECKIFSERVKQCCFDKTVIVPNNADLAILKGAVLYGHDSDVINPRITRHTYGIDCLSPFDETKHDHSRKILDGWGKECCKGTFSLIIKQKQSVCLGKVINAEYYTSEPHQKVVTIQLITSDEDSPLYTNCGSCRCIGKLEFKIPYPSEEPRCVAVEYKFGDTEIKIKAVDRKHSSSTECFLNLLNT